MKKLLSMILALALILTLTPSFALAADAETTDPEGTLTYVIKPSAMTAEGKSTVAALDGTQPNKTSSIDNMEINFVTYKTINYHRYTSNNGTAWQPVRIPHTALKLLSSATDGKGIEDENGVAKEYTLSGTLGTQTAPYDLFGRVKQTNNFSFLSTGLYASFRPILSNGTKNYENASIWDRPMEIIGIKVTAPGTYKMSVGNEFTYNASNLAGGQTLASKGTHAAPVVSLVKVDESFEITVLENGIYTSGKDSNGKTFEDYYSEATKLGFYESIAGTTTTFEDAVTLEEGEYLVVFDLNSESMEKQLNTHLYNTHQYQHFLLSEIKLTPVQWDEELAAAFEATPEATDDYVAPTVAGLTADGAIAPKLNDNGTYTLTAPKTNEEDKPFLYWAKGNTLEKRIISFSNVIPDYVPTGNGRNYLIAVYESDVDSDVVEYFNQNGQRIATGEVGGEKPALPSMAGYGAAKSWEQHGDTNIYVAQYGEKTAPDSVTVTAVDGTVNGEKTATVTFGTKITCVPDATKGKFLCWKKSEINGKSEIVSVDESYEFKAWESCTVTAVYDEYNYEGNTMKIVIDTFTAGNETGVMAEFIGLSDAVEKGIMFTDSNSETTKISMTTADNQFTVLADAAGTYAGYAILKSGEAYNLITDGSYTK